jgi:hypothetical protein
MRILHRRRYEIERVAAPDSAPQRQLTSAPVTAIDQQLGVGDAWALVDAADVAWNGAKRVEFSAFLLAGGPSYRDYALTNARWPWDPA